MKERIEAATAVGPYSQAIRVSADAQLLFVSGQLPIENGAIIEGTIQDLTEKTLDNLEQVLLAGGSRLGMIVRAEVFLIDLEKDFSEMNEVFEKRFAGEIPPARRTVQVAALPLRSPIEISCIAIVDPSSHGNAS